LKEIIAFNQQQLTHIKMHQELVFGWIQTLIKDILNHDHTKFSPDQYTTFVESRTSLNDAQSGADANYQKYLHTEAIQAHITGEPHHPEYWDKVGFDSMPIRCAIQMYYDWKSRSLQRGTSMDGFWETNIAKLTQQPTALAVVNHLKLEDAES